MKHLIIIMLIMSILAGCNKAPDRSEKKSGIADISDLAMTDDLKNIYSERRHHLIKKTGEGTVILRSDYGFDGGRHEFRAADITRTIPVNGSFTKEQKDIYELVLNAQKAAIAEMIPGNYLVAGLNKSKEIMVHGLVELGLITDRDCPWQRKFYLLHGISHYLGMYVHDVGDYGAPDSVFYQNMVKDTTYGRLLEKGMVLTVEPGLYFRSNGLSQLSELFGQEATQEEISNFIDQVTPVYKKYKNIGVRIEDDVLITDSGNRVLSKNIPKEIDEIESIMKIN